MTPVAVAPMEPAEQMSDALDVAENVLDESSVEAKALAAEMQKARDQLLRDKVGLIFDLLGRGLTADGKWYWLEQPNPFLENRRPLDLLWAGRFDEVWAAAESYLVGDFA